LNFIGILTQKANLRNGDIKIPSDPGKIGRSEGQKWTIYWLSKMTNFFGIQ
jgi:hypothetical protein